MEFLCQRLWIRLGGQIGYHFVAHLARLDDHQLEIPGTLLNNCQYLYGNRYHADLVLWLSKFARHHRTKLRRRSEKFAAILRHSDFRIRRHCTGKKKLLLFADMEFAVHDRLKKINTKIVIIWMWQVLPLKNAMKKPKKFSRPAGVLNIGMVFVSSLFIILGFISYWQWGETIHGSVTVDLPSSDP